VRQGGQAPHAARRQVRYGQGSTRRSGRKRGSRDPARPPCHASDKEQWARTRPSPFATGGGGYGVGRASVSLTSCPVGQPPALLYSPPTPPLLGRGRAALNAREGMAARPIRPRPAAALRSLLTLRHGHKIGPRTARAPKTAHRTPPRRSRFPPRSRKSAQQEKRGAGGHALRRLWDTSPRPPPSAPPKMPA